MVKCREVSFKTNLFDYRSKILTVNFDTLEYSNTFKIESENTYNI